MGKWVMAGLAVAALVPFSAVVRSSPIACQPGQKIAEEGFVRIGGIDQWVVIRGQDCANPVVLIVHGGPGNPSTPFAARYEAKTTQPAPEAWWQFPSQYTTAAYKAAYTAGEDYSYVQLVGMKGDGMLSRIDLPALGTTFSMPIFIIQGKEDLLTMPSVTKAYYDRIEAPAKQYILLDRVGHDPNPLMVDAQLRVLKNSIAPLMHD